MENNNGFDNNEMKDKNLNENAPEENDVNMNTSNSGEGNTDSNIDYTVVQDVEFKSVPNDEEAAGYEFHSEDNEGSQQGGQNNGGYNGENASQFTDGQNNGQYSNQYSGQYGYNMAQGQNVKNKKRKKAKKSAASYVAIALVCAILGGGVGAGATYGLMKKDFNEAMTTLKNKTNYASNTATALTSVGSIDIPSVVEKVQNAVVGVSTTSVTTNIFGFGQEQEGLGSGVIFSEDGYVLTNYHVISGANTVKVILSTGQEVEAKVVNYDEDADLAVVKVTEDIDMPGVAELGDSDSVKVGEQVVAIGNPLGKQYLGTVTTGIISALSREVQSEDGTTMTLLQTDTAINAGNSGGPLINAAGQVIGINTAKIQGEGVEGIGFAIPINDAVAKLDVLVKQKITLGITVVDITEDMSKQYNLPVGVYIRRVSNFSIAEKGGLQSGDVITSFGGKTVKTVEEINTIKEKYNDGDTIPVEFVRNGKTMSATLTVQ